MLETRPQIGWLEVHSENYFGAGGPPLAYLERLRQDYPLSLHGVGLSLGSTDPVNRQHLDAIKRLVDAFEPGLVSEHLCWSSIGGIYLNDLLPLPYTEEALAHVVERVATTQEFLKRQILIENVSSYLRYHASTIPEWEFLVEVATRAGCGILLDINNVYVSATNHEFDANEYLAAIPENLVGEIHLAGFAVNRYQEGTILIDNHGARVAEPVWDLYAQTVVRIGQVPTLIEWDSDIPTLDVLLSEANRAQRILEGHLAIVA